MASAQVVRITGMKKFKGEIEGKNFDSTTIYIETRMDDRDGTRRGHCSMDFNAGNSTVFDRLASISLPADFEVEFDTVTNGSKSRQIVTGLRPYKPNPQGSSGSPVKPAV